MSLLGTRLTLLIGPQVPTPAPLPVMEALDRVEVTHSDEEQSGFQIRFRLGRGRGDVLDYALLSSPLLKPFSRVVMVVTFDFAPQVLMDGIITNQQLAPGGEAGASTLTITGEDVSVMMDLEEKSAEHPAQPEMVIALKLIGSYARFGLIPKVIPPPSVDIPLPTERIPVQQDTDLRYLQDLAERFGYVFYLTPGPAPLTNTAYWGPPVRVGVPQKALSVNMGPDTNVLDSLDFQYDSLRPTLVSGRLQDRNTNQSIPVQIPTSTRIPVVSQPAWATQAQVRTKQFRQSGLNTVQALARAQGKADVSMDQTITANGKLDALRYQSLLKPRGLVGLRGVGFSYDGLYYVKRVTHTIQPGDYKQRFTLTREGLGAISPTVRL